MGRGGGGEGQGAGAEVVVEGAYTCSVHVEVFSIIHESLRATNKLQIKFVMKES